MVMVNMVIADTVKGVAKKKGSSFRLVKPL